jgi:hypothetical protein
MVHMNYLNEENRPQSNDPDYWNILTATDKRRQANWDLVVKDWQETGQVSGAMITPQAEEEDDDDDDDDEKEESEEVLAEINAEESDYDDYL